MPTLYLSAPRSRNQAAQHCKDFSTILNSGVGPDYAIYGSILSQIVPGMTVVVFDRDGRRRAEGVVLSVSPKPWNRIRRYDIQIRGLHEVTYTNRPAVNRCGVELY